MALIGKIRQNFWFVLLLLGFALAAFVIMDMTSAGNRGGLGPEQIVGEVAGQKIGYQDFQKVEQTLFSNNQDNFAAKNGVWNYLVERAIVEDQSEALGLGISKDELMDLQFGTNLSPVIRNSFTNPQTGQIDMQSLLNVKQAIENNQDQNGNELSNQFRLSWSEQEKQIKKVAKQEKLIALVSKAMTTPAFAVESNEKNSNAAVSFDYVKVNFDEIDNADVSITDADISSYINANKADYTYDKEQRVISYVSKDVFPTAADSAKWKSQLTSRAEEFRNKTPDQDSIYAINNQGQYSPVYVSTDDLSDALKEIVPGLENGQVYGPYEDNGNYFAVKMVDKKVYPDSVTTRHILRSVTNMDPAQTAAANIYLDSLENKIKTSRETIGTLAATNSQDQSSKDELGVLGPFAQASMISLEYSRSN